MPTILERTVRHRGTPCFGAGTLLGALACVAFLVACGVDAPANPPRDSIPDAGSAEDGVLIAAGSEELLDVFVGDEGIYVATVEGVRLFDRRGSLIAAADGAIISVAFDGHALVTTDATDIRVYDATLSLTLWAPLARECSGGDMLGAGRFLCLSMTGDGVYTAVYSTEDARLITISPLLSPFWAKVPRVAPGGQALITLAEYNSPPNFQLFTLDDSAFASYVAGSVSVFTHASRMVDFMGDPATHLVNDEGRFLRITNPMCAFGEMSYCFFEDGNVGLSEGERFMGFELAEDGIVHGIVDPTPESYMEGSCTDGCLLQSMVVESASVLRQVSVRLELGRGVAFRRDPNGGLVFGYRLPQVDFFDEEYPGYRVRWFREPN